MSYPHPTRSPLPPHWRPLHARLPNLTPTWEWHTSRALFRIRLEGEVYSLRVLRSDTFDLVAVHRELAGEPLTPQTARQLAECINRGVCDADGVAA